MKFSSRAMTERGIWLTILMLGMVIYTQGVASNNASRRQVNTDYVPDVVLPSTVQLLLSAGDPYLAANMNVFRVLIATTEKVPPATAAAIAKLQVQAAEFNPAHEDNYYLAAATLPWWGEVEAGNKVLVKATSARPHDPYPPFFLGFNYQYFLRSYRDGAAALTQAAERLEGDQRLSLLYMASRWLEKGEDLRGSLTIIQRMRDQAAPGPIKNSLAQRFVQLEDLIRMREIRAKHPSEDYTLSKLAAMANARAQGDGLNELYMLDEAGVPVWRKK